MFEYQQYYEYLQAADCADFHCAAASMPVWSDQPRQCTDDLPRDDANPELGNSPGASSHDVYFGTASTPPFVANTSATSYVATTPATGTYYWQILPKSNAGTASGCPVWSFAAAPTDASFAYAKNSYCQAGADPTPTIYGVSGGMFSAPPQVSIAPSTGTIDVSASTVGGPYTITYNTGGACPAGSTFSLSIVNCMPGATLTDALVIDNGVAGKADPGDRIRLTAKISNSQAADYTGVQLTLNNDARVGFVTNSFKSTPVAVDDAYLATKNMQLVVAVGSGVLINDFDNAALNVNANSSSSAQGGSVVINANGSFTYTPPNGFTGNDTFTYTINDTDGQTDMATVRIRVQ
ncbi:MAG: cadherin-like domain-containing protein [Lewinellaceae bacterium]|nr:cadherin-like domain-containing protein [Lewinellaceae bacterium]